MTPQELKNSILQLAIQGKLVEQRPEEGTAEELYQQIKNYQRGIKVGKDELNYDSMDFDIPDSWVMVELNQLFNFVDYRGKTPTKISQGVFLITASNIRKGTMDYTRKEYISQEEYMDRQSRGITRKGDLLFTTEAPMGNAAICDLDKCSCGQRIITFQEYAEGTTLTTLFMYFLLSPQFQKQLLDNCTGTTAKGIKADKLKHFRLPLPPYAEQKRIVAKIEELLPYIDRYEQAWSKLEDFNKRFPTDMQKSILQMAIQGKLVEQRPEEGTGDELYQQIQAEKQRLIKAGTIKKSKPLPEITENEKPFDIPESWKWVRWGELSESIQYGYNAPAQEYGRIKMVRISDIQDSKALWDTVPYCEIKNVDIEKYLLKKNDILFARTGGTVGKSYLVKEVPEESIYAGYLIRTRYSSLLCPEYLKHFMESQLYWTQLRNGTIATAQPNCNGQTLSKMIVPLPPLAEQKRIVSKLEEILPLFEKLK
jgi:type I restriction enzyme S subunit